MLKRLFRKEYRAEIVTIIILLICTWTLIPTIDYAKDICYTAKAGITLMCIITYSTFIDWRLEK